MLTNLANLNFYQILTNVNKFLPMLTNATNSTMVTYVNRFEPMLTNAKQMLQILANASKCEQILRYINK